MSIVNKQDNQYTIDLGALARELLKKLHFIIISMLLCATVVGAGVYVLVTPTYKASVTLYVHNRNESSSVGVSATDLVASARLVDTYAAIIDSHTVLDQVIEKAGLSGELTAGQLSRSMKIAAINETEVFRVSISNANPVIAMRAANALADVATKQLGEMIVGGTAQVVDYAKLPNSIASPNYQTAVVLGALGGLVLSVALIALFAITDNTIRGAEEFVQWEYPLLASVPDLQKAVSDRGSYRYGYSKRE